MLHTVDVAPIDVSTCNMCLPMSLEIFASGRFFLCSEGVFLCSEGVFLCSEGVFLCSEVFLQKKGW